MSSLLLLLFVGMACFVVLVNAFSQVYNPQDIEGAEYRMRASMGGENDTWVSVFGTLGLHIDVAGQGSPDGSGNFTVVVPNAGLITSVMITNRDAVAVTYSIVSRSTGSFVLNAKDSAGANITAGTVDYEAWVLAANA